MNACLAQFLSSQSRALNQGIVPATHFQTGFPHNSWGNEDSSSQTCAEANLIQTASHQDFSPKFILGCVKLTKTGLLPD